MKSIDILKKLREETGISYSLCHKALLETNNNIEDAKKLLAKWGEKFAETKSKRQLKSGAIFCYLHHNKKIGAMVELLCETDFVAKNSDFKKLGDEIALQVASCEFSSADELLKSEYIKNPSLTIEALIKAYVAKIGENITINRFIRYAL